LIDSTNLIDYDLHDIVLLFLILISCISINWTFYQSIDLEIWRKVHSRDVNVKVYINRN